MNNTLDSSCYEIIRDGSLESLAPLSEGSDKQASKIISNELLQVPFQLIKVYLRFKPESDCKNKLRDRTYSVISQSTLSTQFSNNVKKNARNVKRSKHRDNTIVSKNINFTRIFNVETTQDEIFEESVKPDILNFLSGQNFTIMTYGTMGSGKTYTLFGTDTEPGIIPKCIDYIFATIKVSEEIKFRPINGNKVVKCFQDKDKLTQSVLKQQDDGLDKMEFKSHETQNSISVNSLGGESEMVHSIWLSFSEIYNEAVYDLLSEDCAKKDTRLKLVPDKDGTFVKGLRIVHAANAQKAHQILAAAISRLRVTASPFNHQTSRSHGVFTIKLLKYYDQSSTDDVQVYTLNFYDLAGSGHLENAVEKDLFIESRYINKSLLVLNRCIKIVAENHTTKQNSEVVGPFRESCLTRLLQKTFCEKEDFTIFVHLNTSPMFHAETQNILGMVLSLRKVIHGNDKYPKSLSSAGTKSVSRETLNWDATSEYTKTIEGENEELQRQNKELVDELTELKSIMFVKESEIRHEFVDMYTQMIKDHDENWRLHIKDLEKEREHLLQISISQLKEYYEEKIDNITQKYKTLKSIECISQGSAEIDNKNFAMTIDVIKQLKNDLEKAVLEKNDCKFSLALIEEELQLLKDPKNSESFLQSSNYSNISDSVNKRKIRDTELYEHSFENSASKETENQICNNSNQIKELQLLLKDEEEKFKTLESDYKKNETVKMELMNKLMNIEKFLIDNNISYNMSDFISEFPTNELHSSSAVFEESRLSFLYTNIEFEESQKVIARIPKSKFSLASGCDNYRMISEVSSNNIDQSLTSTDSSKNDSGITSESSKSDGEEKGKVAGEYIQDEVEQLKNDYTILKDLHQEYQSRIADLSKELEGIKQLMSIMKESASYNEQQILKYEEQLAFKEEEIKRLKEDRESLKEKCQMTVDLDMKAQECINIIQEMNERITIYEDRDKEVTQFLIEFKEKSNLLENQLSMTCTHFENKLLNYFAEHEPRIQKLLSELEIKNNRIAELEAAIVVSQPDTRVLNDLNEKFSMLGDIINKFCENGNDVKNLNEERRNKESFGVKIEDLLLTVNDWQNKIEFLKQQVENVCNEKSIHKMSDIEDKCSESENFCINSEEVQQKTGNFPPQLLDSSDANSNTDLIIKRTACEELEIDKLKQKLEEQNIFIQRYKSLIKKLQNHEEVLIPDDIDSLDYTLQETDKPENIPVGQKEDSTSDNKCSKSNAFNESKGIAVVKSSDSDTSLTSSSSSHSTMTIKSSDSKKSWTSCWTQ